MNMASGARMMAAGVSVSSSKPGSSAKTFETARGRTPAPSNKTRLRATSEAVFGRSALKRAFSGLGTISWAIIASTVPIPAPASPHPQCTAEGCTGKAWSAGLCRSHYQAELKHRHDYRPPARSNGGYDVRFCNLFVDELQLCGRPAYPEPTWFGALRRADYEFRDLGPPRELKPQLCASEAIRVTGIREPGPGAEADLCRVVNTACTKWLSARGLYQEQQEIRF